MKQTKVAYIAKPKTVNSMIIEIKLSKKQIGQRPGKLSNYTKNITSCTPQN